MSTTLRSLTVGIVANAAPFQRGMQQTVASLRSMVGVAIGAAGGLALLHKALEADKVQSEAVANLNAVLKSTGQAAGFTSQQLQGMASDLQKVTTFGDEATIQAQAMLATFTQIRGDNFRGAIIAAQDLSTVMKQDLQSSIVQIGKALNDPLKGITALSRVGVSFSEQQKALIKSFVDTNQVAKAQKVILDELSKEFGGAATAQAKTLSGQLQQLKNSFGDLLEQGIALIKPALLGIVNAGKQLISFFQNMKLGGTTSNFVRLAAVLTSTALIAPRVISAIGFITSAIKAMGKATATANAIGQAFSGPKGWLQLIVGGGVALASLYAIDALFTETAEAAKADAAAAQENATQLKAMSAAAEQAAASQKKVVNALTASSEAFSKQLKSIEALKSMNDNFTSAFESLKSQGQSLTESLRTPAETFAATMEQNRKLLQNGVIDWETYRRAILKANQELHGASNLSLPKAPQAFTQGTAGAFQAIAESRSSERARRLQEQQLAAAETANGHLAGIEGQLAKLKSGEGITVLNF